MGSTRFTQFFILKNALDKGGFKGWIFYPGMLFNSTDKWWGDQAKRRTPHEGLDLCFYKNQGNAILRLGEKTKVPAIYDGTVAGIMDDFLGYSIIVKHRISDPNGNRLCTIYGHTVPEDHFHIGDHVRQGDVIATLAESSRSKSNIFPHLHISMAWASNAVSFDGLSWKTIGDPNTLTLSDPLQIIDGPYEVLAQDRVKTGDP